MNAFADALHYLACCTLCMSENWKHMHGLFWTQHLYHSSILTLHERTNATIKLHCVCVFKVRV